MHFTKNIGVALVILVLLLGFGLGGAQAETAGPAVCSTKYNNNVVESSSDGQALINALANFEPVISSDIYISGTCAGNFSVTRAVQLLGGYSSNFTYDPIAYPTVLDGGQLGSVVTVNKPSGALVSLNDLTIRNGDAEKGGGLHVVNTDTVYLTNVVFTQNFGSEGGGIYNEGGYIEASSVTFSANTASDGGGLYNAGGADIQFSQFNNNSATAGGAVFISAGTDISTTISSSILSGNTAYEGGAMFNQADTDTPVIHQSSLVNNRAERAGGAIYNETALEITSSNILDNLATAGGGGGIFNEGGSITIEDSIFDNNHAADMGGGIASLTSGVITVDLSTFSGNTAQSYGGSVYNETELHMDESEILYSSAAFNGGGLYSLISSSVLITNTTVAYNQALKGGGIANADGTLSLNTSTLSGNSATQGGGIHNAADSTLIVDFSTMSGSNGGGIFSDGTLNMKGTIIADSSGAYGDCELGNTGSGTFSFNLMEDTGARACNASPTWKNILGQEALLGPLTDNGGPTRTHGLLLGSPAIGKADDNCPNYDQRGVSRPQGPDIGASCDIGAVEFKTNDMPARVLFPFISRAP